MAPSTGDKMENIARGPPSTTPDYQVTMSVPLPATIFLGVVGGFLLLIIIFFLYLNKMLCFSECGGFPCIDSPNKKPDKAPFARRDMKRGGYGYGEDEETSSESDTEQLRHYHKSQPPPAAPSVVSDKSAGTKSKSSASTRLVKKDSTASKESSDEELESKAPPSADGRGVQNAAYQAEGWSGSTDPATSTYSTLQDEHLFDVSDLNEGEGSLISKCGSLEVTFDYDISKSKMNVAVHQARDIPNKERGGANSTQVRLLLLPAKKVRCKTKIKSGEEPQYQETFNFKVPYEEINNMGMRFRVYGCERMRRERMMGETVIGFSSLSHDAASTHWLTLEPRSNLSQGDSKTDINSLARSDSASSSQSMQHGGVPELLLGLAYNGTTGRLAVEVLKGSNFKNMAMSRPPDTYVKLTLMSPSGQEITRSKTSTRRGQPNPLYKETSVFQVALFQLPEVTLMVSVYNKRSMKRKEMIGWFSLGYSNSSEEELAHWTDMRDNKGEQVCRWHILLEP